MFEAKTLLCQPNGNAPGGVSETDEGFFDLQTVLNLKVLLLVFPRLEGLPPRTFVRLYKKEVSQLASCSLPQAEKALVFLMETDILEEQDGNPFCCRIYQSVRYVTYRSDYEPEKAHLFDRITVEKGHVYELTQLLVACSPNLQEDAMLPVAELSVPDPESHPDGVELPPRMPTPDERAKELRHQAMLARMNATTHEKQAQEFRAEAERLERLAQSIESEFRQQLLVMSHGW